MTTISYIAVYIVKTTAVYMFEVCIYIMYTVQHYTAKKSCSCAPPTAVRSSFAIYANPAQTALDSDFVDCLAAVPLIFGSLALFWIILSSLFASFGSAIFMFL